MVAEIIGRGQLTKRTALGNFRGGNTLYSACTEGCTVTRCINGTVSLKKKPILLLNYSKKKCYSFLKYEYQCHNGHGF